MGPKQKSVEEDVSQLKNNKDSSSEVSKMSIPIQSKSETPEDDKSSIENTSPNNEDIVMVDVDDESLEQDLSQSTQTTQQDVTIKEAIIAPGKSDSVETDETWEILEHEDTAEMKQTSVQLDDKIKADHEKALHGSS